mmetsp:Transcript_89087/g.236673  ORF Transcript_89087/g.236673 Transcript_89087/m.236673 type:complete len:229 (-) Transcript_89087:282-968(-)
MPGAGAAEQLRAGAQSLGIRLQELQPCEVLLLSQGERDPLVLADPEGALLGDDLVVDLVELQDKVVLFRLDPELQVLRPPLHVHLSTLAVARKIDCVRLVVLGDVDLDDLFLVSPGVVPDWTLSPLSILRAFALRELLLHSLVLLDRLHEVTAELLRLAPRDDPVLLWQGGGPGVRVVVAGVAFRGDGRADRIGGDLAAHGVGVEGVALHAVHADGDDSAVLDLLLLE